MKAGFESDMDTFRKNAGISGRRLCRVWPGFWRRASPGVFACFFLAVIIPFAACAAAANQPVQSVPPPDQAAGGRVLQVNGVVLCADAGWHQLYVYDGRDTEYFYADDFGAVPAEGQQVEITGVIRGDRPENLRLTVRGSAPLPPATPLEISQLALDHGHWVQITGRVMSAETSRGRLALLLHGDQGQNAFVYLLG